MRSSYVSSILIIDDDLVFRRRLARAVRERGIEVGEASNAEEALEYLTRENPLRVVLDLKIGAESGLAILPQLLKVKGDLRIVVLTGYGTISTAVEALKKGACNYLTKPVDADAVLASFNDSESSASQIVHTPKLDQVEWEHIQRVITEHEGNITRASKALGLHRRSLQRKLGKNPPRLS